MKFTVVTQPTQEPVSHSEFKDHARIDTSDSDGLLAGYILAARHWAEDLCGLVFMSQTIDAYFDCFNDLTLPRGPEQSVTSVTYLDGAGASQTLSASYYYLNKGDRLNRLELAYGYSWPQSYERSD